MTDFIKSICDSGGEVYVVGGAVRNYLYNHYHKSTIKIKDYDFLVRLVKQEKLIKILEKTGNIKEVGQSFGIILYTPFNTKDMIEIAIPRTEISTGPAYKDFDVVSNENITIEEDFSRRDATINSMAIRINSINDLNIFKSDYQNKLINVIDPFGGINDIINKKWKCVGNPIQRFNEDPTRIMRAFRQSSELDLTLNDETLEAIKKNYNMIEKLIPQSYVRLYNEFFRMLDSENYMTSLKIMNSIGILKLLGIEHANLEKICNFNNLDLTNGLLFKFASLLDIENMTHNIKNFCYEKQITATSYFSKNKLNILISIQKYYKKIISIESIYLLLKIVEDIYKSYKLECYDIIKNIVDYGILNNDIPENKIKYFQNLVLEIKNYPASTDQLKIDGNYIMSKWKIKGKDIKIVKDTLLDLIFDNKCENSIESLNNKINEIICLV